MTENEYTIIRQMEIDHRDVLRRVSNIENTREAKEILLLHADLHSIVEHLQKILNDKTNVTSLQALNVLEMMKVGFITMLSSIEQLIPE